MSGGFYPALERVNISLTALQQIAIANMDDSGHKNIVWISPGFPIFSALDIGADGQKHLFDAIRHLSDQMLKARISIYSVDPRGVEGIINTSNDLAFSAYLNGASQAGDVSFGDLAIQTLAVQTGGHAFFGRNDVDREIATSIHDGNTYYTLSYAPANHDFKGEFRKIKVSIIDRAGLKVQTRDGYYAIPDGAPVDPKQQIHDLASSLYAPLTYNGIRVPISYCNLTQTPPRVSVRFIVSTSSLTWKPDAQGRLRSTVTVAAAGRDKKGNWLQNIVRSYEITLQEGVVPSTERGTSVTFELPYARTELVRFVIRDDASGRVGSSEITVDAPKHS